MSENVQLAYVFGDMTHLWLTIKNQSGVLVNADSTPTITIFDSSDTSKVGPVSVTPSETGIYYYTYSIPTDGPEGVWTVEFGFTISAVAYVRKDYMEVFDVVPYTYDTLHPDVIRKMLVNVSEDQLPDATIRMAIAESTIFCTPELGGSVSESDKNLVILCYARYLSYDKYLMSLERVEGKQLPLFLSLHSERLKEQALTLLEKMGSDDGSTDSYTHPTVAGRSMRSYPHAWRDI